MLYSCGSGLLVTPYRNFFFPQMMLCLSESFLVSVAIANVMAKTKERFDRGRTLLGALRFS